MYFQFVEIDLMFLLIFVVQCQTCVQRSTRACQAPAQAPLPHPGIQCPRSPGNPPRVRQLKERGKIYCLLPQQKRGGWEEVRFFKCQMVCYNNYNFSYWYYRQINVFRRKQNVTRDYVPASGKCYKGIQRKIKSAFGNKSEPLLGDGAGQTHGDIKPSPKCSFQSSSLSAPF